jgi:hypothetical protein
MEDNSIVERREQPQVRFVGLDVHKDIIAVAVADLGIGEPRSLGIIRNDHDARVAQEVGTPIAVARLLRSRALRIRRVSLSAAPEDRLHHCRPSIISRKSGDRIKTDRRDASSLAPLLLSGELTPTWIPDHEHEVLREPSSGPRRRYRRPSACTESLDEFLAALGDQTGGGCESLVATRSEVARRAHVGQSRAAAGLQRVPIPPRRNRPSGSNARSKHAHKLRFTRQRLLPYKRCAA